MAEDALTTKTVDLTFAPLEELLKPKPVVVNPDTGATEEGAGELEHSWHFLQVYAGWGLRLPTDDSDFQAVLNTKDVAAYKFYPSMKEGCTRLKTQCKSFTTDLLPKMVQVGNDLSSFANAASNDDGEMFKIVIDLIDGPSPDPAAAIDLIKSLEGDAKKAIGNANEVQKGLGEFKSGLTEGSAKVELAKQAIEEDDKTNRAAMEKLTSKDPNLEGSLANLRKLRNEAKELYDHDVLVAATSPTYAWVTIFGLIAAAVVAGIFGDKAVKDLKKMDELDEKIKNANDDLARAVAANSTYTVANTAAVKIEKYTNAALGATTVVQNGWNAILKGLGEVSTELARTLTTDDENQKLRSNTLVKKFLERTEEKWRGIAPTLETLTKHPYVNFDPKPKSISEIAEDIEDETKKAA